MDIALSKQLKLHMRIARGWLLKKIKKEHGMTIDDIIYDLEHTGDNSVKKMWEIIKKNASECVMRHQRNETLLWSAILLWILTKDTAYRDLFFTTAKDLLDLKDVVYNDIAKLAKDPEHWYPNAHLKAQLRSQELQKDGKLLERGRTYDETIAVPAKQQERIGKSVKGRNIEPVNIYK